MDEVYAKFRLAAGEGALCELHLRLLAAKVSELESIALDRYLENVENAVIKRFTSELASGEADLLKRCRQLRNKLLHCDFHEARKKLTELGAPQRQGGVTHLQLGNARGIGILDVLMKAAAGEGGTKVADTTSTSEGTVFGWLLELSNSGALDDAVVVFRNVSTLTMRLAEIHASTDTPSG